MLPLQVGGTVAVLIYVTNDSSRIYFDIYNICIFPTLFTVPFVKNLVHPTADPAAQNDEHADVFMVMTVAMWVIGTINLRRYQLITKL